MVGADHDMPLPRALAPLRHRDFRLYWGGQAISLTGTWMQNFAQSWVLTSLSVSAADLGTSQLIASLPILLLSLKAGELADRYDKRQILIVTQIAMMGLAFAFAWLLHRESITVGLIFLMSGLLGFVTAFDLPAAQALPPELVEPKEIGGAVAMMQQIFHGSRLVGPGIAGILMARFGNESAFVANGLSFIAVVWSLYALSPREKRAGAAKKPQRGGFRDGLAHVRKDAVIKPLMLLAALTTGTVFPFIAVLMPIYVRKVMHTNDASVAGVIMSMSGLGSLLGATVILWGGAASRRYWLFGGVLGVSVAMLLLSLFPMLPVAAPVVAVLAFSVTGTLGRISQTVQERAPAELRGRVMGVFSIAWTGVMPFAALGISHLADAIDYPPTMRLAAACYLVFGLGLIAWAWAPFGTMHTSAPTSKRTPQIESPDNASERTNSQSPEPSKD